MLLAIKSHLHIHSKQIASAACARMKQGTVKSQEGDHFHRVKKTGFHLKANFNNNLPYSAGNMSNCTENAVCEALKINLCLLVSNTYVGFVGNN